MENDVDLSLKMSVETNFEKGKYVVKYFLLEMVIIGIVAIVLITMNIRNSKEMTAITECVTNKGVER